MKKNEMREAEKFFKTYRPQIEALEKNSILAKLGLVSEAHIVALGRQLDQWKAYESYVMSENGNLNALGKLPTIALDVISVAYGNSVLPIIASVQPIEEQQGIVYFKNIRALNSKGTASEGDILTSADFGSKTVSGYAGNEVMNENMGVGDATEVTFSGVLAAKPLLRETLVVSLQDSPNVKCVDVGPEQGANPDIGNLYGKGVFGTINYVTGAFSLTFNVAPATGKVIYASYQQNYEASTDIPKIQSFMDSTMVKSKVYALKGTVGMLQSFTMQKRFGGMLEDQLATDIVAEINKEIGGDAIRMLRANSFGSHQFDKYRPVTNAITKREHYGDYVTVLNDADSTIVANTGRGSVQTLIAGVEQAALLASIPEFKLISNNDKIGPHVFGTLGNRTVIRVPEASVLGAKEGVGIHKGANIFEAALVYAPFMPLAVTDMLPEVANPLVSQRAAATMAGLKTVMPKFATKIDIVDTTPAP